MNQDLISLLSFAKINLNLRILGKRVDGFHELFTIFQTVSLHDKLSFSKSDDLVLTCNDKSMPTNESNLIIMAGKLLSDKFGIKVGANIELEKKIPFPGGLGGGSSNAAITLLGLSRLWGLDISFEDLCEIGSQIGSDVPFFLYGGTAIGTGRGEKISYIKDFEQKHVIVITPDIEISTPKAFAELNAEDLTNIDSKSILKICHDDAEQVESGHLKFINDFEESIFKIEPRIKQIKEQLLNLGAKSALLSGSGASVFAVFDNENQQQVALSAFESENNLRKFAVKTVSRQEYRDSLEPCKHLLPK